MAFNVSNFKAQRVSQGFQRAHSYEMIIAPPVGGGELLVLSTESVNLPGAAFLSADNYKPFGAGRSYSIPYAFNPTEIAVQHLIDKDSDVYQTFVDWSNSIVDFQGDVNYTAYYLSDFAVDAQIKVYDQQGNTVKTVQLFEVFPLSVDQVSMSWNTPDAIATVSVNYKFTDYKVS